MVDIPVTVFIRPHGEQREAHVSRPQEIADIAVRIAAAGGKICIEELGGMGISYTVEFKVDGEIQDIACTIGFDSDPPNVKHISAFDECLKSADKFIKEYATKDPT